MKTLFQIAAATSLVAFAAPVMAGDADKSAKGAEHKGVMTEKLGDTVPTMTNEKDSPVKETAHDAETYTGAVGKNVPEMTTPDKSGK